MADSLQRYGCSPPGSYVCVESPGRNTGVGYHALFQGIFPNQGSNPALPHCRRILYHLSHQGSPRILEWVTYPFSRGSSWPRNWTRISCIAGRFFTSWATREALIYNSVCILIPISLFIPSPHIPLFKYLQSLISRSLSLLYFLLLTYN